MGLLLHPPKSDDRYAQLIRGAFIINNFLRIPHFSWFLVQNLAFFGPRQLVRRKVNIHLHTHTLIWCVESRKSNILSGTREKERTKTSFVYPHQNRSRTFSKALFWWKIHDINQTASLTNEIEQEVLQHRHIERGYECNSQKEKTTLDVLILIRSITVLNVAQSLNHL